VVVIVVRPAAGGLLIVLLVLVVVVLVVVLLVLVLVFLLSRPFLAAAVRHPRVKRRHPLRPLLELRLAVVFPQIPADSQGHLRMGGGRGGQEVSSTKDAFLF